MDQEIAIVDGLRSKIPEQRTSALNLLYSHCFKQVENYVLKNRGTVTEAEDIFQDGILILFQNVLHNKFRGESSVNTYLYSICKNLWLQKLRKESKIIDHLDLSEIDLPENTDQQQINNQLLLKIMHGLKNDCQKILKEFYYNRKSMDELAKKFRLGSPQAAKNKKSRCLKRLTSLVKEKGLQLDHFVI